MAASSSNSKTCWTPCDERGTTSFRRIRFARLLVLVLVLSSLAPSINLLWAFGSVEDLKSTAAFSTTADTSAAPAAAATTFEPAAAPAAATHTVATTDAPAPATSAPATTAAPATAVPASDSAGTSRAGSRPRRAGEVRAAGSCCYRPRADAADLNVLFSETNLTADADKWPQITWTGREYRDVWRNVSAWLDERQSIAAMNAALTANTTTNSSSLETAAAAAAAARPGTASDCELEWDKTLLTQLDGYYLFLFFGSLAKHEPDAYFHYVDDVPSLPRILHLGDSITRGIWRQTQELFGPRGVANIHGALQNCKGLQTYNYHLSDWLGDCTWDLIQFNIGMHFYPWHGLDNYEQQLGEFIVRMRQHSPDAEIVFALTTPSPFDSNATTPNAKTCEDYHKFPKQGFVPTINQIARNVSTRFNVTVNDRYGAIHPKVGRKTQDTNHAEGGGSTSSIARRWGQWGVKNFIHCGQAPRLSGHVWSLHAHRRKSRLISMLLYKLV
eukprot:scaffold90436_cov47-Attheya_sp.AAC.1